MGKVKSIVLMVLLFVVFPHQENIFAANSECNTNLPNPPLSGQIKITEIQPADTGDDNGWVGLKNVSSECVDLAGWVLYDGNPEHELFITRENTEGFSQGLLIAPGLETKVFQKGDKDFTLVSSGGRVELYSGPAEMLGKLQDAADYPKINKGESYRAIADQQEPGAQPYSVENQKHIYQIPEDNNEETVAVSNQDKTPPSADDGVLHPAPSSANTSAGRQEGNNSEEGVQGPIPFREESSVNTDGGVSSSNETIKQSSDIPTPLIASSALEKSSWRWFYWLWGSWFFWRIILPFAGLWLTLYTAVYLLRHKLTKQSE